MDFTKAVVEGLHPRIIIGTDRVNQINRAPRRGPGTQELVKLIGVSAEFDMGQKQMLVEVTGSHTVLGIRVVEKTLPFADLNSVIIQRCGQFFLFCRAWSPGPLGQPARDQFKLLLLQWWKAKGHPVIRMFGQIVVQFNTGGRTGHIHRFGKIFSFDLRIFHLMRENLEHQRIVETIGGAAFGHGVKILFTPFLGGLGIDE